LSGSIPYGYTGSRYPHWLERDIGKACADQKKMAVIFFFMIIGIALPFLYVSFKFSYRLFMGILIIGIITGLGMIPLWRYSMRWVNDQKGSFLLRASSDDDGYYFIRERIKNILEEAKFDYRQEDGGFQETLATHWLPRKEIMLFSGELKVAELSFDITRMEGLEIKLNSLDKFPGLEKKLINDLNRYFIVKPGGGLALNMKGK